MRPKKVYDVGNQNVNGQAGYDWVKVYAGVSRHGNLLATAPFREHKTIEYDLNACSFMFCGFVNTLEYCIGKTSEVSPTLLPFPKPGGRQACRHIAAHIPAHHFSLTDPAADGV